MRVPSFLPTLTAVLALASSVKAQTVVINEIDADNPSTDSVEFIELYDGGMGNTDLSGFVLVLFNGADDEIYDAIDLQGQSTNDDGFFVVGSATVTNVNLVAFATNGIQNGADAVALYQGDISTFMDDVALSSLMSETLIDAIVYDTSDADDTGLLSGLGETVQFNEDENGSGSTESLSRVPDFSGTFMAQDPTPGAINMPIVVVDPPNPKTIMEIQGEAHTSPLVGDTVDTSGIVTAVDSNGFYLQDPDGDDNLATSDAIFVFTGSGPTVAVGDEVTLTGVVSEFTPGGSSTRNLSTTQLSSASNIVVVSSGNTLPDPVLIGTSGRVPPSTNIDEDAFTSFDPETDGIDFFESLEAMLVTVEDAMAVAGTTRFGEIFAVANQGADATGLTTRKTLNLQPDDFNPEKVQIDEDMGILAGFDLPSVNAGDQLGDVTGVVGYSFGNFEVYPTEPFTVTNSGLGTTTTSLMGTDDQLVVATYNVLNLDPSDADDGRFAAIAAQIVNNLRMPDIIGLQEVQDNSGSGDDGITDADVTLQTLVDAIAATNPGGPSYSYIDNTFITNNASGGQPGGNIRTAFLYRQDRVSLVPDSEQPVGSQEPGQAFEGARLPLSASFMFNDETVTLVNNHFSSKGGSAPILGVEQPFDQRQEEPEVNGSLNERRVQAQAVNDFVDSLLAENSMANVIVLGDLNEFEFISPLDILAGTTVSDADGFGITTGQGPKVLNNLILELDEIERYTFIFQGNSQVLDHILVSNNMNDQTEPEIEIVFVNSEFAEVDSRASDHEPVISRFTFQEIVEEQPTTSPTDLPTPAPVFLPSTRCVLIPDSLILKDICDWLEYRFLSLSFCACFD